MTLTPDEIKQFLGSVHPYDSLPPEQVDALVPKFQQVEKTADDEIYVHGATLSGLYLVHHGEVEVRDENDHIISILGTRNSFGERGLLRDGLAVTSARATAETLLLLLPADVFGLLIAAEPSVARFFDRRRGERETGNDLATSRVSSFMAPAAQTCTLETPAEEAARQMRDARVSSLCVTDDGVLRGIVTIRDMSGKIVAQARDGMTPVQEIMTPAPLTLSPDAIGSDVLHAMMEHHIGHIPIIDAGKLVGMVTQTDLTRFQAVNSAEMVREIASAADSEAIAKVTAEIPRLLLQLVASGNRHEIVTRLITDIADTATRRLLALAEEELGAPPVPYLWLACGSQGRQEQTGVSDQDNCLMIDDAVTDADLPYFEALTKRVCDGLNTCGYVYCPGDMMATNPRWRQPVRVWRDYFDGWIARPNPEAQMLASVMFDLRPIGGTVSLFSDLHDRTLARARANSIFVAHMISNSLKHTPPLGLLRGFATIRSGEHRNTIDMKHNGVVPIVDLGRIYALRGALVAANTRARLRAASSAGVLSKSGGRDLIDAYDLIADTRLEHQAEQVKAGQSPDNYLAPANMSDFERSHLRDAFVVVKSMQSALGHGQGAMG